ncbi:MAG TPA: TonB-dependent receptor [Kofleriaceae bacterium]
MSPKTLALALAVMACPRIAEAQEPLPPDVIGTAGRVIDVTGAPVARARIGAEGSDIHATTDANGFYTLSAPLGTTLVVEHDGDEMGIATVTGATLDDVVLRPLDQGETIELHGEKPFEAPGAAVMDRAELERVPGTGGDVVQTLRVMPGVTNIEIPIGLNGIPIRGSSPQDSRVLVDGFEIPMLYHGLVYRSVLPAESIASLDYIPGGFGVENGRATSGIVSITTRPGDEKRSVEGELSVLDGGVLAQGSAGKRTTYLVGMRRSTIDLVLPSLMPSDADLSLTTVPYYYDGQLRIDHRLDDHWRLFLSGIGATDTAEIYTTKDTSEATKRLYAHTAFARVTAGANYHEGAWTANVALSGVVTRFDFAQGTGQVLKATLPNVSPRAEVIHTSEKAAGLTNVEIRAGAEAQVGHYSADIATGNEPREGEAPPPYDPHDMSTTYHGEFWVNDVAQWVSVAGNLDPKIRATVGVRSDELARTGEVQVQPRAQLELLVAPKWIVRASSGAYRRPPEYQSELLQARLDSERASQEIVGVQWEPREGTRVQGSAYYTDRTHLITREMDGTLGNEGRGTTVGAELIATHRMGPWFAWLSYTYAHSRRVDHPGDESRLFSYDQPHNLNAAASWKHGRWTLGGRFQLYSGLPYTPVVGSVFDNDRNIYVPMYGETNSARAPMHHQLDLRVDYTWKWGPTLMTAFADVQNVYLNKSPITTAYSFDYTQSTTVSSLPIIPMVGLKGVL